MAPTASKLYASADDNGPKAVSVVLAFWGLGIMIGLLGIAGQWRLARLLVRNSRTLDHEQLETDCALLSERFGIRTFPEVRVADNLSTPLLTGFWNPTVLLPHSFLSDRSPRQLRMMLAHELAHIKRRDLWWTWLAVVTRLVFFFHPLVWLAKRESRLAEEMAADELAVKVCHLKTIDYAGMLVEVAARFFPQKEELVVGIVGSHQTLKRRLRAMKYMSTASSGRMIAAAIVTTTIGLGAILPWRLVAREQTGAANQAPRADSAASSQAEAVSGGKSVFVDAEGQYSCDGRVMELNEIVSELKNAQASDPQSTVQLQADQEAPFSRLVALLDKMNEAGLGRVSVATIPHAMLKPQIFDVAFGVSRPEESKQTGPAAAGCEGDYWNTVGVAWSNDHTESDLKFASGEPSQIQVRLTNLGGAWGNDGHMGVRSPMLDSFNYPVNNQGGNSQVTISKVPAGKYDVYIYGHGVDPLYYGDYTLTVGNQKYGRKATSNKSDAIENTSWVEGSQYIKFASVQVGPEDKIEILIQPGGQVTDHWGRTFADAMISGLQLIPVAK